MTDLKEKYASSFKKVNLPNKNSKFILKNIKAKKEKTPNTYVLKPVVIIPILLILFISITTAYAKNIKDWLNNQVLYIDTNTNRLHGRIVETSNLSINVDELPKDNTHIYSYEEMEKLFNIKFLKNKNFDNNVFSMRYDIDKGNITKLVFDSQNPVTSLNAISSTYGIVIYTKDYIVSENPTDTQINLNNDTVEYYYIKSLNTNAVISNISGKNIDDNNYTSVKMATFTYNDIVYCFNIFYHNKEEINIYNILENFYE